MSPICTTFRGQFPSSELILSLLKFGVGLCVETMLMHLDVTNMLKMQIVDPRDAECHPAMS